MSVPSILGLAMLRTVVDTWPKAMTKIKPKGKKKQKTNKKIKNKKNKKKVEVGEKVVSVSVPILSVCLVWYITAELLSMD